MNGLYRNRTRAGQQLAGEGRKVLGRRPEPAAVVVALPRGGVPVAHAVAEAFDAPLDVLVTRTIALPDRPEVGIGVIAGEDPPLFEPQALEQLDLTPDQLAPTVARERAELHRREELYRSGRPAPELTGRTVILVDDGVITGLTVRAALRLLRAADPGRLVLAVPVGEPRTVAELDREVDLLVCPRRPAGLRAVGLWYEDFTPVTDREVIDSLARRAA
ncbi:phosphoribosyltransferase [Kitasatospora sp. MMS16-BH015]|uniref:phosphoribosyltransferase n=1 Tax=Kitasatospora sp. MMS16-BH015 TaxID=2018025 RepID=UPI000CA3949E|nr:phosphoribosyltransferase family protein [Kitasatospora sp. MMS16-BH015]AUG80487.1 phosphoribosyltransferase [Kitasatospora sp. MMS16-BH015]